MSGSAASPSSAEVRASSAVDNTTATTASSTPTTDSGGRGGDTNATVTNTCGGDEVDVESLQRALVVERAKNMELAAQISRLKSTHAHLQMVMEQEEECLTNKLIKYVEQLQRTHTEFAAQVEREEEYMTNSLQKRLDDMAKEKVSLENQLEQEEEYIVNKLLTPKGKRDETLESSQKRCIRLQARVNSLDHQCSEYKARLTAVEQELWQARRENLILQHRSMKEHDSPTDIHEPPKTETGEPLPTSPNNHIPSTPSSTHSAHTTPNTSPQSHFHPASHSIPPSPTAELPPPPPHHPSDPAPLQQQPRDRSVSSPNLTSL
ncbi:coiled-coil domain-containing protein 6 [Pelomyxa schiedti]|nr:coiled-coil domain-containing protein 6 [Pelomyxa schiedti]